MGRGAGGREHMVSPSDLQDTEVTLSNCGVSLTCPLVHTLSVFDVRRLVSDRGGSAGDQLALGAPDLIPNSVFIAGCRVV